MIKIEDYQIFKDNVSTLKETSFDLANNKYMVDSLLKVVDFDGVKRDYLKRFGLQEVLRSNDALSISEKNKTTFIEFKNGDLKGKTKELKQKIPDSLLIFSDITEITLSSIRNNTNYILVYNENKNPKPLNENYMKPARHRTQIGNSLKKLGKTKFIRFNLGFYEKLFFNEVFTYTEEEFKKEFVIKFDSRENNESAIN